jgi:IS30 family transposase
MLSAKVIEQLFIKDSNIDDLVSYLKGDNKTESNFIKKIKEIIQLFKLENDKLFYNNREIVKNKDKESVLKKELKENPFVNKQSFYKVVISSKYVNITRDQANRAFLGEDIHQLSRKPIRVTKKSITTNKPGLFSIDLIEFSENINKFNKRYSFILVAVEVFSRYTLLSALTSKKPEVLYNKFIENLKNHNISDDFIRAVTLDNGTEFSVLKSELSKQGVRIIQSQSYSPLENSIVERRNQEVRNRLRVMFNSQNNLVWYNKIDQLEDILNNSYIKSIKGTPLQLLNSDELQEKQRETNNEKRKEFLRESDIKLGTKVRIDMAPLYSQVRKAIKTGDNYKNIQVRFTPFLFEVIKKSNPRSRLLRPKYTVQNISTKKILNKKFYAHELQEVQKANNSIENTLSEEKQIKLLNRAHKLNGTKIVDNDIDIV